MTPKVIAPCKLCDNVAELRDSHIVPRWAYRRLVRLNGAAAVPVHVEGGTASLSGRQPSEYMLCGMCEELLSSSEKYASALSVQPDGSFPACDGSAVVMTADSGVHVATAPPSMDCDKIAFFAASVLWRASVSRSFPNVRLGGTYESEFRKHLMGLAPWPSHAKLVLELMRPRDAIRGVETMVVPPESHRQYNCHAHKFAVFGMRFHFFIGARLPDLGTPSLIERTVVLSDGAGLLADVASAIVSVVRKGKLATT